jgi:hypothetical protein
MRRVLIAQPHGDAVKNYKRMEAPSLKRKVAHNDSQFVFRAQLWREFVSNYQTVLATSSEEFSEYCDRFRKLWINGRP